MGKDNVKHSRLVKRLKQYVALYKEEESTLIRERKAAREGVGEQYRMAPEMLEMHRNSLNFLTEKIIKCKKEIKQCQKSWHFDQALPKKNRPISKQQFISFMKLIQEAMQKDEMMNKKILDIVYEYKPELKDFISITPFDNSELYSKLLNWIATAIGDDTVNSEYGSWVDYFVFDTEWGNRYNEYEAVVKDKGQPVPFKTLSDVYNAVQRFCSK